MEEVNKNVARDPDKEGGSLARLIAKRVNEKRSQVPSFASFARGSSPRE